MNYNHNTFPRIWNIVLCSMFFVSFSSALSAQTDSSAVGASVPLTTHAVPSTGLKIGYLSNETVMRQMPQYAEAQRNLDELKNQYEAEAKRSEKEFQTKFEEFLQEQQSTPQTILQKRQNELQSMLDANIAFRTKVQALLDDARNDIMADVKSVLKDAISSVAEEKGINIVLNTDGEGVSFVTPGMAEDLTGAVLQKLGIAKQNP